MENVYDTRAKEKLLYILPEYEQKDRSLIVEEQKIAIAVNLYYPDTVKKYIDYLNEVPKIIDVYIISSNPLVWEQLDIYQKREMYLIKKNNRGRDISALLVAFREIALQYQYVCFIHDKKAHSEFLRKDVDIWIQNLWGNTVGSANYIYNVLNLFEKNQEIGLLVPPEPLGEYFMAWCDVSCSWGKNYDIIVQLVEEFHLNCDIDKEKAPITIGTVFWAKTKALEKLFLKEWKYEDFPQEPMAIDGTINHAIERIFAYVAQDAGFKTGTIMSKAYAEYSLLSVQDSVKAMCKLLEEELNLYSIHQIKDFTKKKKIIREFYEKNSQVYLYGAGVCGIELLGYMEKWELLPTGFVVSNGRKTQLEINKYPVKELQEIILQEGVGIIVAVHSKNQKELIKILEDIGFTNYIIGYIE